MGTSKINLLKLLATVIIVVSVLVGCSSQFDSSVRKVTYPPDFKYTDQADLRSDMHQLATQMAILDNALVGPLDQSQNQSEPELQREQVLSSLRKMSKIAVRLHAGKAGANHPFMDDYMQGFISELDKARTAASLQSPRYSLRGKYREGAQTAIR